MGLHTTTQPTTHPTTQTQLPSKGASDQPLMLLKQQLEHKGQQQQQKQHQQQHHHHHHQQQQQQPNKTIGCDLIVTSLVYCTNGTSILTVHAQFDNHMVHVILTAWLD